MRFILVRAKHGLTAPLRNKTPLIPQGYATNTPRVRRVPQRHRPGRELKPTSQNDPNFDANPIDQSPLLMYGLKTIPDIDTQPVDHVSRQRIFC